MTRKRDDLFLVRGHDGGMLVDHFPLLGLRLTTPRLELRLPSPEELGALADLDAAEAVCTGEGVDRNQVFDLVAGLVDKSILTRADHNHGRRPTVDASRNLITSR